MEQIKLNKENPEIELQLTSELSYILIQSVSVTSLKNGENQWTNFIAKVKLTAELKYVVFVDSEKRFVDERKEQFPIHLLINPYQVEPVFQLNKLIRNEVFTLGINPERKFYNMVKLKLNYVENLYENYTLTFNIEKFRINE